MAVISDFGYCTRLLRKLQAHGITGSVLRWIDSWLTGRQQRVVLNGEGSTWADVLSGVPQGSLLGPVLFTIYINDIDLLALLITLLLKFADDTKLGQIVRSKTDAKNLQDCLDNLMEWAAKWGMAFNTKKCKVMHIGRHNPRTPYHMGGEILETTEEERDIGVLTSCNLKPSGQCAKAANTANAVLGQINRAFHFRDRWTFIRLYKLYVRPHLEFAAPAWCPWNQADIEYLEKVQRRAVKMVSGLGSMSYEERLKELGMETLRERREELDMVETFKIMNGISNVQPGIWFDSATAPDGGRVTRQAADPLNVRVAGARLDIRKHFFSVRVCEKWNSLPSDMKTCKNAKQFKTAYQKLKRSSPPQAENH